MGEEPEQRALETGLAELRYSVEAHRYLHLRANEAVALQSEYQRLSEVEGDLAQYRRMWDDFARDHVPLETHRKVVEQVERLARDNEEMSLAMSSVHVGDLMDALAASEAECERLAGRVAALETALAEAADWLDEDLYDGPDCDVPLAAVAQADRSLVASWREVLAVVGGSE